MTFDEFWSIYPRRVAKKKAKQAWDKIKVTPEIAEKIRKNISIQLSGGHWKTSEMSYIPHPATYLNGERWDDEVYAPLQPVKQGFIAKHSSRDWADDL